MADKSPQQQAGDLLEEQVKNLTQDFVATLLRHGIAHIVDVTVTFKANVHQGVLMGGKCDVLVGLGGQKRGAASD